MLRARWILTMLIAGLTGCQYALPSGFVKADPGYESRFRAVSADGSAVTLRTEENPENGDLAFWEKAVAARLTEVRGYRLVERKDAAFGRVKGAEMGFDYEKAGVNYTYVVMLCVEGRKVHCIEIAGVKDKIGPQLAAIREAVGKWPL